MVQNPLNPHYAYRRMGALLGPCEASILQMLDKPYRRDLTVLNRDFWSEPHILEMACAKPSHTVTS